MSVKLCGGSLLHRTTPPKWVPKRRLSGSRTKRGITSGIFGRGSQDAFRERKWRVCCCPLSLSPGERKAPTPRSWWSSICYSSCFYCTETWPLFTTFGHLLTAFEGLMSPFSQVLRFSCINSHLWKYLKSQIRTLRAL